MTDRDLLDIIAATVQRTAIDVAELKADVAELKADMAEVKGSLVSISHTLDKHETRIAALESKAC